MDTTRYIRFLPARPYGRDDNDDPEKYIIVYIEYASRYFTRPNVRFDILQKRQRWFFIR